MVGRDYHLVLRSEILLGNNWIVYVSRHKIKHFVSIFFVKKLKWGVLWIKKKIFVHHKYLNGLNKVEKNTNYRRILNDEKK